MSSYRGAGGAWDGGAPGAEEHYPGAPRYDAPAPPRAMPTTDPWTGVSYSQYDYQAYAPGYGYGYDSTSTSTYYQRPDGTYYGKYPESRTYPPQPQAAYEYTARTLSPIESRRIERRRSCRTNSRSVSPYDRQESSYSKKRDSSYEEGRRRRSRSKSSKRKKYSSSDRSSSRSRSYSHSPLKREKKRKSVSSNSSVSERSYKKKSSKNRGRDRLPPPRDRTSSGSRGRSRSHRTPSVDRPSKSPKIDEKKSKVVKSHSRKDKKIRKVATPTPPRKRKDSMVPLKKADKSSLTPPPKVHKKYKDRSDTPAKKGRESSLTPPKTYRRRTSSTSKSRSRSPSLSPSPRLSKRKRSISRSPRPFRSRSSSGSGSSTLTRRSRSKSKRKVKRKSRTKSRSIRRSVSNARSTSRRPSKSRGKGKRSASLSGSKSRSRSRGSRSRSRSVSASDDERRGQFTVADRKRFWKMHRNRQEEIEKEKESKTPPKEVKPPPGAVESTTVDDIEYGDPPEVEGPNFAELLHPPDQVMQASTSKSKPGPIPIKNDGSFLEMFKKMQEETKKAEPPEKKPEIKKPALPFIGKRRGGRVLKTGLVKKAKAIDEQTADNTPKDAWSLYMQEVKKYRETSCEEERKTRPLVK